MGNPRPQIRRPKQQTDRAPVNRMSTIISKEIIKPMPITTLEGGSSTDATQSIITLPFRHQLPYALLIECLLEQLCAVHVSDSDKRQELFDVMKKYLVRAGLLCSTDGFPGRDTFRYQLNSDLYQLFCTTQRNLTENPCEAQQVLSKMKLYDSKISCRITTDGTEPFLTSRYKIDFTELEFIASGGFGVVYKSRNKLDGNVYAIKKIVVGSHSANKIIREVQLLSRLHHPNVVAYKSAWLELSSPEALREMKIHMENTGTDEETSTAFGRTGPTDRFSNGSSIVFKEQSSSVSQISASREESFDNEQNLVVANHIHRLSRSFDMTVSSLPLVLYIQMQLYPQTLRMWLKERNERLQTIEDNRTEMNIFRQILSGVEYVHNNHIVHRDIKPDNIFLCARTGQALIGDFGLAKLRSETIFATSDVQSSLSDIVMCPSSFSTSETRGVGTQSYASPEQLEGTHYDSKSDMYSLGIVLLELLTIFKTEMERHKSIENLRKKREVPQSVIERWPLLADLILDLTGPSPHSRPTAGQSLERTSCVKCTSQSARCTHPYQKEETENGEEQRSVPELLKLVEKLKQELAEKNETIERLTRTHTEMA